MKAFDMGKGFPTSGEGSDFLVHCRLPRFRGEYCTVYQDESEVVVYGSGSDWQVQYSQVTNHAAGWRRWFSGRDKAEAYASELSTKPYKGRSRDHQ